MPNANLTLAYPMRTIFHLLPVGFALGPFGFVTVFRYQQIEYVGIPKLSRWGYEPMQAPNANGFAFWWNIGFF